MSSITSVPTGSGPYAPSTAGLGGIPSISVDVPITSVFLFLFILGAITHMTILQINKRKGHKFLISGVLFGFCMARNTACILRLVWATHVTDVRVAIAANVFFNAGVVLLLVINLIFTQRIVRAMHPRFGWSRPVHFAFLALFFSIPAVLVMLITAIVQQLYTLNPTILGHDRTIVLFGSTYNAVISFLPIPIILTSLIARKLSKSPPINEKFGIGHFRVKVALVLFASTIVCLGACFRASVAYMPRPANDPAWYHSKACYYCFDFMIEIIVVYTYAIARVDRRFWVPNGSSKVRHYRGVEAEGDNMTQGGNIGDDDDAFDELKAEDQRRKAGIIDDGSHV